MKLITLVLKLFNEDIESNSFYALAEYLRLKKNTEKP